MCELKDPETLPQNAFIPIHYMQDEDVPCEVDLHVTQMSAKPEIPQTAEESALTTFCLCTKGFCLDVPLNLSTDRGLPAVRSVIAILHALGDRSTQND